MLRSRHRSVGLLGSQAIQIDVQFLALALNDLAVQHFGRIRIRAHQGLQLVKEPLGQIVAVVDRASGKDDM